MPRVVADVCRHCRQPRPSGATVFINEFHYDNAGANTGEFVEIAGPAGTNLSEYAFVLYNGANGQSYTPAVTLSGTIPNLQNGFGVLSFAAVSLRKKSGRRMASRWFTAQRSFSF